MPGMHSGTEYGVGRSLLALPCRRCPFDPSAAAPIKAVVSGSNGFDAGSPHSSVFPEALQLHQAGINLASALGADQ